jgi:hypothetical protein
MYRNFKAGMHEEVYNKEAGKSPEERPRINVKVTGKSQRGLEDRALLHGKEFFGDDVKLLLKWANEAIQVTENSDDWTAMITVIACVSTMTTYTPEPVPPTAMEARQQWLKEYEELDAEGLTPADKASIIPDV